MIVDDFYVFGMVVDEAKANTILLIDADGVLTFTVTGKGFESVAGWKFQVVDRNCGFN